jgi:hypothetical protein
MHVADSLQYLNYRDGVGASPTCRTQRDRMLPWLNNDS